MRSWILATEMNRFLWSGPDLRPIPGRKQNDEWQTGHRYMQLEGMAELAAPTTDPELAQIPPKAA